MSEQPKLDSIQRFLKAALSMADIHTRRAQEEVDETGHSCYSEGWAAGYQAAVQMIDKFVGEAVMEQ